MRREFGLKLQPEELLNVYIASAILLIILYATTILLNYSRAAVIVDAVLAIVLYPLLVGKLGGVQKDNVEFLKKVSNKVPFVEPLVNYAFGYMELFVKK